MFTGIVREKGRVAAFERRDGGARITVDAPGTAAVTAVGDSVSVSGVCLTAVEAVDGRMTFDAVAETLRRTALSRLRAADVVNVEPALRAGDPLGGHYVQGHVDGVGRVRAHDPEGDGTRLWIEPPRDLLRYCVEKGSVAVDGVSLTIAELAPEGFAIALVPHTLEATTLGGLRHGDAVNVEVDVLAKYVERLLSR